MQNLLFLGELKSLGVCPCRIYYLSQNCRHWVCAHAKFITLTELNTLGALCAQGPAWGRGCVVSPVAAHAVWRGQ